PKFETRARRGRHGFGRCCEADGLSGERFLSQCRQQAVERAFPRSGPSADPGFPGDAAQGRQSDPDRSLGGRQGTWISLRLLWGRCVSSLGHPEGNPLVYVIALATDYDETLAEHGRVSEATFETLKRFKETGRRLIMVTGRELPDLKSICPYLDI